ncbi:hypothetical protein KC353_g10114 [Hortaea werneckii]|uniref:CBF1-interacting co-repressor CIR N-terminal domain-containing protein n=1 Tax=Hortaea werneckii TaxID=91943 RepID=A0A3M7AS22_HORWE|nr:hypothetical protein KC353_g10114 [Hortaea werneckii]RMY30207.1 hypothetical protein D0865_15314 [Hortaea werneckii]
MPLHLLGKKSWNVYNEENIARVRRDEAAAKAEEEAEEQRMQEEDSARRIALLRGEQPAPLSESASVTDAHSRIGPDQGVKRSRDAGPVVSHERKRRRLRGEDDTDRDIRHAREDAKSNEKVRNALTKTHEEGASLVDESGHLQLFAPPKEERHHVEKNSERQDEQERKRKRDEDRYTMRFSNANGFRQGTEKPWYASQKSQSAPDSRSTALQLPELAGKDVWGNEDPLRKERERNRISSNDPFAAMQQAQRQLKQSEHDRARWQTERAKEIDDLKRDEERTRRHSRRHHRRNHGDEQDGLEGFSLDSTQGAGRDREDERKRRHHHHRRRHSRSPSRERRRHRHSRSRDG